MKADSMDLVLLIEECGEVVQAASKALRFGLDHSWPTYHDGSPNHVVLAQEIGDLLAVIDRLGLSPDLIQSARAAKHLKLEKFGPGAFGRGMLGSPDAESPLHPGAGANEC